IFAGAGPRRPARRKARPDARREMARPRPANKKGRLMPAFSRSSKDESVPRHGTAPAEAIIDAELDRMLVVPQTATEELGGSGGESGVAEIVVLVLAFDGPVRREHVFETGADGPAVAMIGIGREGHRRAADTDTDIVSAAPGVAALGIEQGRTKSVSETSGDRAKLVGICGHQSAAGEKHAVVAVAGEPAVLRLGAEHPVVRELVVEPALHAADESRVAALQVVGASELSADVATDVEARPVVDNLGYRINRRLRVGPLRKVGAECRRSERNTSGCAEQ